MRNRTLSLALLGAATAVFSCEYYLTLTENENAAEARRLNGIGEGERWFQAGTVLTPPAQRSLYQGPIGDAESFLDPDPELGYRLKPHLKELPGRLKRGGKLLYDVRYSTNKLGRRAIPPGFDGPVVAFFGDSYTFGHGLNTEQSLPYLFARKVKTGAFPINFAVPGYGPQQLLRYLELGREKREFYGSKIAKSYYLLIREHLPRLAGLRAESAGSPRYRIEGGLPVLAGHYSDHQLAQACSLSAICELALQWWRSRGIQRGETGATPEQLAAVLSASARILRERHGSSLTVISWNPGDPVLDAAEKALREKKVDVVRVADALPGFPGQGEFVFPDDGHPNARAIDQLAQYLAERVDR